MELLLLVGIIGAAVYWLGKSESGTDVPDFPLIGGGSSSGGSADVAPLGTGGNMSKLEQWAKAVTKLEGKPGDLNYRNNNPGNITGNYAGYLGTDSRGFAKFPTFADGMAALIQLLGKYVAKYPGFSVYQSQVHYLGGDGKGATVTADGKVYVNGVYQGDARTRANLIAKELGVTTDAKLGEIFG